MNVRSKVLLLTAALLFFQEVALCQEAPAANDLRGDYDVTRYELELAVTPETQTLEGKVAIIGVATAEKLKEMQVDLYDLYKVLGVTDGQGTSLTFTRTPDGLVIDLGDALNKGDELVANIHYVGQPKGGGFDGFH